MRILIAEDDMVSRRLLEATLRKWGYDIEVAVNGRTALEALSTPDAPPISILDWEMPEMTGPDVCRAVRAREGGSAQYLILVTSRGEKPDVVQGLDAGANDYITKPFDTDELRARIGVGVRVVELQVSLATRVAELQAALEEVQTLRGIIPICCYCKKVRSDHRYWQAVEEYLTARTGADFSHGICPECWENVVQPEYEKIWGERIPYEDADQPA